MSAESDAASRWAAAHARSLGARLPTAPLPSAATPTPTTLASFTEARSWSVPGGPLGVGFGALAGRPVLAVGQADGAVGIWDPETGELIRELTGHTERVYSVDWGRGADGRQLLASGSEDATARVWEPETGELVHVISAAPGAPGSRGFRAVNVVAWATRAAGTPLLALGCLDGGTRIWNASDPDTVSSLTGQGESVASLAWGHRQDGEQLLATCTGSDPSMVRIWDPGAARLVHSFPIPHAYALAWAARPGERAALLASGPSEGISQWTEGADGTFTAMDFESGQDRARVLRWMPLPDGRTLIAGCRDRSLFVLDGHTLEPLHTESADFTGALGWHHLDWAVAPDGGLLLAAAAAGGTVHVWRLSPDSPDSPVRSPAPAGRPTARPAPSVEPSRLLDPPLEVTAEYPQMTAVRVHSMTRPDGTVLLATSSAASAPQIWDPLAGRLLCTLHRAPQDNYDFIALGQDADGRLLLAAGGADQSLDIYDGESGAQLRTLHTPASLSSGTRTGVNSLAWGYRPDGQPVLAAGLNSGEVLIWDADAGLVDGVARPVRFTEFTEGVWALAWGRGTRGQLLLAGGSMDRTVRVWDPDQPASLFSGSLPDNANSVAWVRQPDGRWLVTAADGDQDRPGDEDEDEDEDCIRSWEPETGERSGIVPGLFSRPRVVAWTYRGDGLPVLAVLGTDQGTWIWDQETGTQLGPLPGNDGTYLQSLAWVTTPGGDLLLFQAGGERGPVRVWLVATGASQGPGLAGPPPVRGAVPGGADEIAHWLLRLGRAGLWPPLGLVADVVALTGPDGVPAAAGTPSGQRLAALAEEPGVRRLRDLGWAPPARVSFAALLAGDLELPGQYTPPEQAAPGSLLSALVNALTAPGRQAGDGGAWQAPLPRLRAAAAQVTDQMITLLAILGADACAADPLLPVRLAHHVTELPALRPSELRLLADPLGQTRVTGRATGTGTFLYSPGTAGLARTGPLTRLLPTQLALPRDVMTIRLAENQLLYRQQRAPAPPSPEPVTVILDTTPPTFGPAGTALRLAAHLITVTLWAYGRHPHLVTLTDPGTVTELHGPADLVSLWTSRTLSDPLPALATASDTATASGRPVILCTHQHTARAGYTPGPATRLITTHQPPEVPPRPPGSPWHVHLSPGPTAGELARAVAALLLIPPH